LFSKNTADCFTVLSEFLFLMKQYLKGDIHGKY